VLVRLSHSHVRFGSFQRLAYEGNRSAIDRLLEYCIGEFDPDLVDLPSPKRTPEWFNRVVARTAKLAAQWMAAGFVHGVLNTDNMNITGESFDYGPWRFLPTADFAFTAAYFDEAGLYAYGRQPEAAAWNLSRLGGTLLPLAEEPDLNAALQRFPSLFEAAMVKGFFARLGVAPTGERDFDFVVGLLEWMERTRIPFERPFFDWFCGAASERRAQASPFRESYDAPEFADLKSRLLGFAPMRPERLSHPYFAGSPCTMLIDEMESIWAPIAARDDWRALEAKLAEIDALRRAHDFPSSEWSPAG
jgi:uncharacterized protein YdiU (UPF0061 family)